MTDPVPPEGAIPATFPVRQPEVGIHAPIAVRVLDAGIAEVAVIDEDGHYVGLGEYLRAMEARILDAVREAR